MTEQVGQKWFVLYFKGTKKFCYFKTSEQRMQFIAKNELKYTDIELSSVVAKSIKQDTPSPTALGTKKR